MRFGITLFLTDRSIRPDEVARAAEDLGLDGIYLPEHTHIPASRATPAPMGEPLPEEYRRCLDPFVALTAMAAVTDRIRLGTGICLVAQRDPIVTAKEVATLDLLSGGRFVFGVGFGWNVEEMADHGVEYDERREAVREKVLAMRALWTEEEAAFDGEHVRFGPSWAWPKPAQDPHPPVLLGAGAGSRNFADIAEYADGWIPIGGSGLRDAIPELRRTIVDAGRDPDALEIMPFGSTPDRGKFEYFAELGITEVVANAPSAGRDEVLAFLEDYAAVAAEVGG